MPADEYSFECKFLKVKSLINVSTFLGDNDWEFKFKYRFSSHLSLNHLTFMTVSDVRGLLSESK